MLDLNDLAFQNADILIAIADKPGQWNKKELAAHVGRDDSNLGKTLKRLVEEGLLQADPIAGLTPAGEIQLAAINRARHGGERRRPRGRWPLDKLRRNPANRLITEESVAGMADSIWGAEDILMPLVLSPPDANGVRTIWAGERRWKGALLLEGRAELPAALGLGVPFVEREATPAEAALIAVIENTARKDLTPWEDAQMLLAAAEGLGIKNASELARRIGRARDGDRGGVRDVQEKLKVARAATPAAIAAYERDGSWDALRESCREIVTTKAQRLALAELWHKADRQVGRAVPILPAAFAAEGERLAQYGLALLTRSDRGDTAAVTQAGLDYLTAEDLTGNLQQAHHDLRLVDVFRADRFTTAWLNAPATSAPSRPDPEVLALAGIEPVRIEPAAVAAPSAEPCAEVWAPPADAERGEVRDSPFAPVHGWTMPMITLTEWRNGDGQVAWSWRLILESGTHFGGAEEFLENKVVARERAVRGLIAAHAIDLPAAATRWLNSQLLAHQVSAMGFGGGGAGGAATSPAGAKATEAKTADTASAVQPATPKPDPWERDGNDVVADTAVLLKVQDFVLGTAGGGRPERARELLLALGLSGPFGIDEDPEDTNVLAAFPGDLQPSSAATIDVGSKLPTERARALTLLVAWALNRAFSEGRDA